MKDRSYYPRYARIILAMRWVEERLRLGRRKHPRLVTAVVLLPIVLISVWLKSLLESVSFGFDPEFEWWAQVVMIVFVLWAAELVAEETVPHMVSWVADQIAKSTSAFAGRYFRTEFVWSAVLVVALVGTAVAALLSWDWGLWLAIPFFALAALIVWLLIWARLDIDPGSLRAVRDGERMTYTGTSRNQKREFKWTLEAHAVEEPDIPVVSRIAALAFGVEGPNGVGLLRREYMEQIHTACPEAFRLVKATLHVKTGNRTRRLFANRAIGYVSVIPLTASAVANYVSDDNQLSQFEFDAEHIHHDPTPAPAVYLQAIVNLNRYRWHAYRVPRATGFFLRTMLSRMSSYGEFGTEVKLVLAEATTDDGRRIITRNLPFLRVRRQPGRHALAGSVTRSKEGHDFFFFDGDEAPTEFLVECRDGASRPFEI
ncbi:MAG: hypothetical protein NXI31_20470 [bacterium]|nr:hypothetical protein [bacterium]